MPSGKSQIKSKKTKLIDKKKNQHKPIPISSDEQLEDSYQGENIQKRRRAIQTSKQVEAPHKFNNFNAEKFKKVEYNPTPELQPLLVQQTTIENPLKHTEARALFSFKVLGHQATKYVSDLYLQQRLKQIEEAKVAKAKAEEKKKLEKLQEEKGKGQEAEGEQVEERKRAGRYFENIASQDNENRLVKCFRCGKKGHIAKNCIEERTQMKCMFCLGDHHQHDCNSRLCFKCNEVGHIAQQCRATGLQCRKCGKKGHVEKGCGGIKYLDYSRMKSDSQLREKYGNDELKKLRCMAGCKDPNGHFNCHSYHQFHKQLPFESFMRYNDHPENQGLLEYGRESIDELEQYEGQLRFARPQYKTKGDLFYQPHRSNHRERQRQRQHHSSNRNNRQQQQNNNYNQQGNQYRHQHHNNSFNQQHQSNYYQQQRQDSSHNYSSKKNHKPQNSKGYLKIW